MHTKLIKTTLSTLCLLATGYCAQGATTNSAVDNITWELPIRKTLVEVKTWARETLTKPEFAEVGNRSTNMLVIVARAGWGRPSTSIVFVYSLDGEENVWRPRLVWNSDDEQIRVEKTGREGLLFKSKAGKTLMTLPNR